MKKAMFEQNGKKNTKQQERRMLEVFALHLK